MKSKAFTLIELLVVIAIIALLMAIIVPTLNKAKIQTYHVICRSNLRQVGICQSSYAHDNNGRITPGDGMDENGPSHIWDNILVGDGSVQVFKDDGVLRCEEFVPAIWPQGLRSDLIFAVFDRELGLRQPVGVPLPIDFDEFYSNPWSY